MSGNKKRVASISGSRPFRFLDYYLTFAEYVYGQVTGRLSIVTGLIK